MWMMQGEGEARELDRRVAQAQGWHVEDMHDGEKFDPMMQARKHRSEPWKPVPHYSTDPALLGTMLEWLTENGYSYTLTDVPSDSSIQPGPVCSIVNGVHPPPIGSKGREPGTITTVGASTPEAVARAIAATAPEETAARDAEAGREE